MLSASDQRPDSESLPTLRFVTAGSVDDGKSTLIGRLLFDSKGIFEDHLAGVRTASKRYGTTGGDLDLALLTDGLKAEREQGITIDVAYRYFATPHRKFIIADCPGHEQYTRNMATGASTADLGIVLVDATKGVLTQTRRHAFILTLLGVRHLVLAVNKMDRAGWDSAVFDRIASEFQHFVRSFGPRDVTPIPLSALTGDNVTTRSAQTPWYTGPTLLEHLERVDVRRRDVGAFRLPVQLVSRPDASFRGYMGQIAGGMLKPGDSVVVLPAGTRSTVEQVYHASQSVESVQSGQAVTVTLTSEIDASRGDTMVRAPEPPPIVGTRLEATLVWLGTSSLVEGRSYRLKHTTRLTTATVRIRQRIDVNTLERSTARTLDANEIAEVSVTTAFPLVFDAYATNASTGAFILIDRETHNTVAAGMILGAGREVDRTGPVTDSDRAWRLGHRGLIVSLRSAEPGRAEDVASRLERLVFESGGLASVVDSSASQSAVEALAGAGLLVIRVGWGSGVPVELDAIVSDDQSQRASLLLEQLRRSDAFKPPMSEEMSI
jgi:bifunctional enzyme CysN/CysC